MDEHSHTLDTSLLAIFTVNHLVSHRFMHAFDKDIVYKNRGCSVDIKKISVCGSDKKDWQSSILIGLIGSRGS